MLRTGETLFATGEAGTLGVVAAGRLDVTGDSGAERLDLGQIEEGEVVGEIAALLGGSRTAEVRAAMDSEVIVVSPTGVKLLVDRSPSVVRHLYDIASERLRRTQLAAVLSRHFGAGVDGEAHPLTESVEWISLAAGSKLFTEGDEADAAYVVVSGRLREMDTAGEPASARAGTLPREFGAGDLVGGATLIRATPRRVTVAATRDSTLARLPGDVFDRLARQHPDRMLEVVRSFLDELLDERPRETASGLTIAVINECPTVDITEFTASLGERLNSLASTQHLSRRSIDDQLDRVGIADSTPGSPGDWRVRYLLDDAEQRHEIVVLETDPEWSPWTKRVLGQADHVLILVDATSADPSPRLTESAAYELFRGSLAPPRTTLVLLHPQHSENPRDTARWLGSRPVTGHLHVRRQSEAHLARLARIASGRAIGLVLGAGGARGFAHLGVIQAMRELKIPIDMVAASSIGAPIAVVAAMEFGDEEIVERSASYFADLKDYTIPIVAVLRGRSITQHIAASTEGRSFEDCWVPFFCVSASLTKSEEVVHRRGPMAPAIRASVSIPGVLPPVALDGDLLVDGASVNGLPVDRMRELNPTGTIIAVDTSRADDGHSVGDLPLHVSGWAALIAKLRTAGHRGPAIPGIGATLVAAGLIGANRDKRRQIDEGIADFYLPLDVQGLGLLDFSPENVKRGAVIGYNSSIDRLRAWRDEGLAQR